MYPLASHPAATDLPLAALPSWLGFSLSIAAMIFGFGFVVFFHELGHFLAAKWVKIRVEQFAVGFGQALVSWRKGMGVTWGSSRKKYEALVQKELEANPALQEESFDPATKGWSPEDRAALKLGLGDTEYRLNWIPLGGYVKMLGQDDLRPNSQANDPRAYNRKSVGARMLVVSAGVIMNIILAMIGFMVLFLIGFNAPPPVVGAVEPFSPAQKGGLLPGDRILTINGAEQQDFTKILLSAALLPEGKTVDVVVRRPGVKDPITLHVLPERYPDDPKGFLAIGIGASPELRGLDAEAYKSRIPDPKDPNLAPDALLIHPGDAIVAVDGQPLNPDTDYYKLIDGLQKYDGTHPVMITVRSADGKERAESLRPHVARSHFEKDPVNVAGMQPRVVVRGFDDESTAKDKLKIGDVIEELSISDKTDRVQDPSREEFVKLVNGAADNGKTITAVVRRDGKSVTVPDLKPTLDTGKDPKTDKKLHGFGVVLDPDDQDRPVVADVVKGSAAARAGLQREMVLTKIDGKPVNNWFEVRDTLGAKPGEAHEIAYIVPGAAATPATGPAATQAAAPSPELAGAAEKTLSLTLNEADAAGLADIRYATTDLALTLHEMREPRKTSSLGTAAVWGVQETRDFVLQFYVTIKRMFQGSVSAKNVMGPLGMVQAGAKFATKGVDWLLWFLAMISANLAVVNFLPIPIVDGGLFTFLLIEKVQGRPASPRTQAVAQLIGLALIASVFLLVTYQDIVRMIGWR